MTASTEDGIKSGLASSTFATVAGALGSQQAPEIADHVYNAMAVFAAHVAQGGGRCRVAGPPSKCSGRGPGKSGGSGGCSSGKCSMSFGAGTLVLTKEGLKPIEVLPEAGD